MVEWLGIEHLVELTGWEAAAGFLTPLAICAAFAVAQVVLPGRRVTGYVVNEATGEPRSYHLNGLLVFVIAGLIWGFELIGMPRDWFYRSSLYAVAGGTALCVLFSLIAVFSQPRGESTNLWSDFWTGRSREFSFIRNRFDVKMYLYVVGGTMLSLNALSGAAYHYDRFGADANPGIFLFAAFFTFYIFDYFVFERVQLYTYDLIHERLGFMLIWGGLIVYGWIFIIPLWGMAAHPDPAFSTTWTYVWLALTAALFLTGWGISRGASLQKYWFKRFPDRKFLGLIEPKYLEAGERKILYSGLWGLSRHLNYMGEGFLALSVAFSFGHFGNPWAWTYAMFVFTFFIKRQRDDERLCAEKYGAEKWEEYKTLVKYRIFPGIY